MLDFLKKSPPRREVPAQTTAFRPQASAGSFNKAHMSQPTAAISSREVDVSTFSKVINFILLALVFLMPVLFLPFTSEVREFNKQAILFFGVVVMLAVWVIKILTTRTVSWVKTSLDYILMAFTLVYLLASFFSIDKVSSFLGYYGRFTGSFLSVLSLVVLYFLIVNNVRSERMISKISNYLLGGSAVVVVYSLLQLMGIYLLPFEFAKDRAFNPIGSMVGLSIFTALTLIFLQWSWLTKPDLSKYKKIGFGLLTIAGLLVMLLINAFIGWVILTLGMIAFIALGLVITSNDENTATNWFWKPMLVLVVGILFTAFHFLPSVINPRNLISVELPIEIQLSNSTTWSMVKNSLSERPILGSGPGTTGIVFGDIKPEALNKTVVWSLNFDRSSNEVANIIIETGVLGLLAFELTAVLFLLYGLFFLLKKVNHPGRMYAYGFFTLWLALYVTHFFYFFNTTFYFMYWVSLAVFMAVAHWQEESEEEKSLSFSSSPRSALSWMFASLLILAGLLVGAFFQAAVYAAETSYVGGIKALNQQQPNFAQVSDKFYRALTLNPYRDVYYLAYGQNLIFQSSEEAGKNEPNVQQIQAQMADLINAGREATRLSPNKASNWSALAQFYTGIRALVSNTDPAIIESWSKAIEYDNKNPILLVQRARAYAQASEYIDENEIKGGTDTDQDGLADSNEQALGSNPQATDSNSNGVTDGDEVKAGFNPAGTGRLTAAQMAKFTKLDQTKLAEAEKDLKRAIELKADLPDPYIELARVLERGSKLTEARKQLDEAFKLFPNNADIRFEQGRVAFNQKNYSEAENIFLDIVGKVPNHANAHYSLGLVYQQRNEITKALSQFEKVRELTGPNVQLEELINSLKSQ